MIITKRANDLPPALAPTSAGEASRTVSRSEVQNLRASAALTSLIPEGPSDIADLATKIVVTYLEKSVAKVSTLDELNALIESTFSALLKFEVQRITRTGELITEIFSNPAVVAHVASGPGMDTADDRFNAVVGDDDQGPLELPNLQRIRNTRRPRDVPSMAVPGASLADHAVEFDTEAWLASFSNPTEVMIAEARGDNPNNKRGWIGVYQDHIVCLFTGRKLKILGAHLKRLFKGDENFSSFATHAGYVEGLKLPVDYPKAAPYLSTIRTDVAARRGKGDTGRPAAIQNKIDKVLAKTEFDLSLRDKPATRPGNFPDFVVCLECGEAVHDIRPHLRDRHNTYYDRYKRDWHISGRAPATGEEGMSFIAARRHAAQMLEQMGVSASEQVKPTEWPGVLKDKVLCMIDGQLVDDLAKHLSSTGQAPLAHYRARYELPANYPSTPPSARLVSDGDGTTKKKRGASAARKPITRANSSATGAATKVVAPANNQRVAPSVARYTEAPETKNDEGGLQALTEKLQQDLDKFKQRKAVPNATPGLPPAGRTTVETRVIEAKGIALPVTVERRPSKLRLKRP